MNEVRVDSNKKVLSKLQRIIDYVPKDSAFAIEMNEKIINIVEFNSKMILEFNNKIQSGKRLRILTPNKMLRRLPISLAQFLFFPFQFLSFDTIST